MIDVAHDGHDRSARQFNVVSVGGDQFFIFLFGNHFLKGNKGDFITKTLAEIDRDVVIERLIDGREDAALKQQRHHVLGLDAQLLREFLHRRAFDDAHRPELTGNRRRFQTARDAILERQSPGRRNYVALVKAAGLAFHLSSAARGRAIASDGGPRQGAGCR